MGQSTAGETYPSTITVSHEGKLSELIRLYEEKLKSKTTTHVCLEQNQSQEYLIPDLSTQRERGHRTHRFFRGMEMQVPC